MNAEIRERHELARELDRAALRLDLDGLRFVVCVTILRGMSKEELDAVNERFQAFRINNRFEAQK